MDNTKKKNMKYSKENTIILGAGIAGLACSFANSHECIIYEKNDYPGGLCHSFQVNGFTFDSAVHLSFTGNKKVRDLFDMTEYITHNPVSYNYYHGLFLKHPVANNLFQLEPEEKVELIASFVERDSGTQICNYKDYLRASFGNEISKNFQEVYTRKYWTMDASELSATWVGNRLCAPDLRKVLKGAFLDETGNDYYASEMRYPKKGGYQSFLDPILTGADIRYNKSLVSLDMDERKLLFEDGTEVKYKKLISSIPLPDLAKMTVGIPDEVKSAAERLCATKASIVSVGFTKPDIAKWIWMYVYDQDIKAARINSPSLKSSANAPEGCSSLQFEIYHQAQETVNSEEIKKNVKYSLLKMKLCEEQDIMFMDYRILPYANVVFYQGMEADRDIVRNYYEEHGIELIGRFGEWDYFWSDQSFISGYAKKYSDLQC